MNCIQDIGLGVLMAKNVRGEGNLDGNISITMSGSPILFKVESSSQLSLRPSEFLNGLMRSSRDNYCPQGCLLSPLLNNFLVFCLKCFRSCI